jgi:hypothetical protein
MPVFRKSVFRGILIFAILVRLPAFTTDGNAVITQDEFFNRFLPALDSFSRAEGMIRINAAMNRRISVGMVMATPMSRSLAETNMGFVDVTPMNSSMGVVLNLWNSEDFWWQMLLITGMMQLYPYSQFEDESGNLLTHYSSVYKMENLLLNHLRVGDDLRFRIGWENTQSSATEGALFIIEPGQGTIDVRFDPLRDKFLFSTNVGSLLFDLVIQERFKTFGIGNSWNVRQLSRAFTGLYADSILDFLRIGAVLEGSWAFLDSRLSVGYFPGKVNPLEIKGWVRGNLDFTIIPGLSVPLILSLGGGYDSLTGSFRWGWRARAGLFINPSAGGERARRIPFGFHIQLTMSQNSEEELLVMPVADTLLIAVDMGFHFL